MKKKIIIIGASAAGIGTAVKLRGLDKTSSITILTNEKEMPYNRCLLADYLAGSKSAEDISTKKEDFFLSNNISLLLNSRVTRLIPKQNKIELENGEKMEYDQLFLGVGRSSRIIPIPGHDAQGVFSFYDLNDSNRIINFALKNHVTHAVIIGAGLSGLECADALASRNIASTIIEQGPHPLPNQLHQKGAICLETLMNKHGVTIIPNTSVSSISVLNNNTTGVILSSGKKLTATMVIFAVGGKINSDLAQKAGITCKDEGIVVDESMKTSIDNIFAGGDVCRIKDLLTGEYVQSCLWTDAIMQGFAAAHAMSAQPKPYKGALIITSSHIFGTTFVTCGPVNNTKPTQKIFTDQGNNFHHQYITEDGILKGFSLVGNINHVGKLRQAILTQSKFTPPEKQKDVTPQPFV